MQKGELFSLFYVCIVHFSLKDELYLFWKAIILEIKKCILGLPTGNKFALSRHGKQEVPTGMERKARKVLLGE